MQTERTGRRREEGERIEATLIARHSKERQTLRRQEATREQMHGDLDERAKTHFSHILSCAEALFIGSRQREREGCSRRVRSHVVAHSSTSLPPTSATWYSRDEAGTRFEAKTNLIATHASLSRLHAHAAHMLLSGRSECRGSWNRRTNVSAFAQSIRMQEWRSGGLLLLLLWLQQPSLFGRSSGHECLHRQ